MAAQVLIGNVLRVITYTRMNDQNGLNISHWRCTFDTGTGATDKEVSAHFDSLFGPLLKPWMADNAQYLGTEVQIIGPTAVLDRVATAEEAGAGTASGQALPGQAAAVISLRTGLAGRANRGRKYIPFGTEAWNDVNVINAAGIAILGNIRIAYTTVALVTGVGGTVTLIPVVYPGTLTGGRQITSASIDSFWGTQRRRSRINRADGVPDLALV